MKLRVLFLCNRNCLRSPTAERIFSEDSRLEVRSAGVDSDATVQVTRELLEWADVIFVMERRQRNLVHQRFADLYRAKPIICLYIPDEYALMDPALIELLRTRVAPHLAPLLSAPPS
ncbi:MAG TPA: hypothetical protein VGQ69_14470 [Gemmatimonadales bacterium]|jgi:predicted protein tyrosine phosphatase|nr:hypothetical protein [Gemmatimonadales bacterium]